MSAGTFFKPFSSADRTTTRTLLHESIPITGALVSGTYNKASDGREKNVKVFSHNMYESIYDYPYLSSSANHIFDVSVGISPSSSLSSSAITDISKKVNVYNQMAQILNGYDLNGNIRRFDADGDFSANGTGKMDETIFLNFSRLLVKDEIKKGSFNLKVGLGNFTASSTYTATITDFSGSDGYFVNSPAGEYGILYASASNKMMTASLDATNNLRPCGVLFYQAGVAAITASLFQTGSPNRPGGFLRATKGANVPGISPTFDAGGRTLQLLIGSGSTNSSATGSTITNICDGIRNKIIDLSFNNTTELNSTIYFCRASHNEFNYSSNPTYLSGSKVRVKGDDILAAPRSYVTTVGLYAADNELLAVAKLSEPLRKDPTNELTLRVRLDY